MNLRVFSHSVAYLNPASTICGIGVWCFCHFIRVWGTSVEILVFLPCPTERLLSSLLCVASCIPLLTTSGPRYTFTACGKSALQKRISDFLPAVLITCWGILFLGEWTVAIIDVEILQRVSTAGTLETSHLPEAARKCGLPRSAERVTRAVRAWGAGSMRKDRRCWGCLC